MRLLLCFLLFTGFTLQTVPAIGQGRVKLPKEKPKKKNNDDDDDDTDDLPEDPLNIEDRQRDIRDMSSALSLELPMNRMGTGTSWNPDKTPMYGYMIYTTHWIYTINGHIFPRYTHHDIDGVTANKGAEQWDIPGFVGFSAQRRLGDDGQFHYKAMATTDRPLMLPKGYPMLMQTGAMYHNEHTPDWQHPRDVIAELSASYVWSFADHNDIYFYGGYPGEPALGPVSYFQRSSCQFNPDAPLMHSRTDGAFTAWGVGTVGFRMGKFKLEGSLFNGKLPGDNHYNVEMPQLNSFSGRLSWNPTSKWSLQVSRGELKGADPFHPGELLIRNTASATFIYPFASRTYFASSLIAGQNKLPGRPETFGAIYEATVKAKRATFYSRYEYLMRSPEEFVFPAWQYSASTLFNVHTGTLGAAVDLVFVRGINLALGAQASGYLYDANLQRLYGKYPYSGEVYLHFYPVLQ